jgi:nitroreductase
MTVSNGRTADHPISAMFLDRWSPRSFTGDAISDADLAVLFEAARWAPSSSNAQPWRFLYTKRDSAHWSRFFGLLNEGNKRWVNDASALIAIVSKRTLQPKEGRPSDNYSHSFDSGAAWAYLALQASLIGWIAHGMGGFDRQRAVEELGVPDDHRVECMVALGRLKADAAGAAKPNTRAPQTSFVREGVFPRDRMSV